MGVDSRSRTPQRRTLKLAMRIGHQPLRILVDLVSISNCIDDQEYIPNGIKVEAEDQAKELKMVDGTVVRTKGRVQFVLKYGRYRREIPARVFPNMNKQ